MFLSSSTLALRAVKCALRWIRNKDDGLNSVLGGMAAGYVGSLTLDKNYWYILLMFVASRILSAIHQYLMQTNILDPTNNHFHYFVLFLFSNIVHCYGYFIEPDILRPDVYNLYERMSVLTPNEKRWHLSSLIFKQQDLRNKGVTFFSDYTQQKIDKLAKQVAKLDPWLSSKYFCYIYIIYRSMNTTSFQTTHYNHAHQATIQGSSNLKLFAGEDLSIFHLKQLRAIVSDCSKCNQTIGGDSRWKRNKEKTIWIENKKNCLTIKLAK